MIKILIYMLSNIISYAFFSKYSYNSINSMPNFYEISSDKFTTIKYIQEYFNLLLKEISRGIF